VIIVLCELEMRTNRREEFILITGKINDILAAAGIESGCCTIFIPHTTAAITVNESADPDVMDDLLVFFSRLAPLQGGYRHREGNSDAHIKAALLGSSLHLIVRSGSLDLGMWQGVFLAEFDGPRRRSVKIWVDSQGRG
jgi:secondary thiamine-phosphate synthase enzyme